MKEANYVYFLKVTRVSYLNIYAVAIAAAFLGHAKKGSK